MNDVISETQIWSRLDEARIQSYDLGIYNYNASVVRSRLERFLNAEENVFVSKTH
jgi:hypothetical protein